jgi:hypothetical protein
MSVGMGEWKERVRAGMIEVCWVFEWFWGGCGGGWVREGGGMRMEILGRGDEHTLTEDMRVKKTNSGKTARGYREAACVRMSIHANSHFPTENDTASRKATRGTGLNLGTKCLVEVQVAANLKYVMKMQLRRGDIGKGWEMDYREGRTANEEEEGLMEGRSR